MIEAVYTGLFLPYNSVAFGALPRKQRVCAYALCVRCFGLRDRGPIKQTYRNRHSVGW